MLYPHSGTPYDSKTVESYTVNVFIILQDPECKVQGLYENKEYEFRVCAVNENGEGDYLTTDHPIVAKLPFGEILLQ